MKRYIRSSRNLADSIDIQVVYDLSNDSIKTRSAYMYEDYTNFVRDIIDLLFAFNYNVDVEKGRRDEGSLPYTLKARYDENSTSDLEINIVLQIDDIQGDVDQVAELSEVVVGDRGFDSYESAIDFLENRLEKLTGTVLEYDE